MKTRKEMLTYIFDLLEDLDIINWTPMYNRQTILEAFNQTEESPHAFCGKTSTAFNGAMRKVFNTSKVFTGYKGRTEKWDVFLLRLIGYKKCPKCKLTLTFSDFYKNKTKFSGVKDICKNCTSTTAKKERKENKEYIVKELGGCCQSCGYDKNYAALDIHHELREPELFPWTIYNGSNKKPSGYLINISKDTMKYRFDAEKHNLKLLCRNCHQKVENTGSNSNKGMKEALEHLGYKYKCNICEENINLHLHHNSSKEREYGFGSFQNQSKDKILSDKFLEKEIKKDITILCGNHHMEIHNK